MRLPSDAQAAALALVAEFERDGLPLYWPRLLSGEQDDLGGQSRAVLWSEHEDRQSDTSQFMPVAPAPADLPRKVTLHACVRHGWLDASSERVLASGLGHPPVVWSARPPEPVILRELALAEDGTLALGLWRQRKLTAPAPEPPPLTGRDREIVALAEHAVRLGFRIAPRDDRARADARRLAREGWVTRGRLGASVRTVLPTAVAQVEVNPTAADAPPAEAGS